ncbi:DUF3604 domain-containing protein [Ruegeria sp. 6PALISEP08]|uniref:DUF3604 domain-containing protein n=1 Tax=Ruegeria sp. 6PALISEP08 TaxID=1225660 RepID=UPI000B129964
MGGYWGDLGMVPSDRAMFFVRVREIPKSRRTHVFGVETPEGAEMRLADRAYTIPIWPKPAE